MEFPMLVALTWVNILVFTIIIFFILLFLSNDSEWIAALMLTFLVAYVAIFTSLPVKDFFARPDWGVQLLTWGVEYVIVGLVVSVLKWVQYSRHQAKMYRLGKMSWERERDDKVDHLRKRLEKLNTALNNGVAEAAAVGVGFNGSSLQHDIVNLTNNLKTLLESTYLGDSKEWHEGQSRSWRRYGIITVKAEDGTERVEVNKAELAKLVMKWAAWWPFYAVLLIVSDALHEVWQFISTMFTRFFTKLFSRIANFFFRQ